MRKERSASRNSDSRTAAARFESEYATAFSSTDCWAASRLREYRVLRSRIRADISAILLQSSRPLSSSSRGSSEITSSRALLASRSSLIFRAARISAESLASSSRDICSISSRILMESASMPFDRALPSSTIRSEKTFFSSLSLSAFAAVSPGARLSIVLEIFRARSSSRARIASRSSL